MIIYLHLTWSNIVLAVLLSSLFLKLALTLVRNNVLAWYARDCELLMRLMHRWRKLIHHD